MLNNLNMPNDQIAPNNDLVYLDAHNGKQELIELFKTTVNSGRADDLLIIDIKAVQGNHSIDSKRKTVV